MLEPEYFAKKRLELGLSRGDSLESIQSYLEGLYPGQVHARQLHKGVLRVQTPSAPVANALRMRQLEILAAIKALGVADPIERLQISIG